MAQDIVGSLFGMQQQPNYFNQDYQTAVAVANANDSKQMGRFLGGMIGAPLGRAAAQGIGSLLGVEDPRLQQASIIREAQQQGFDVTTPEGLQQLAQFFVQRGQPGLASQVAQQMQTMQTSALNQRKTQLDITKTEEDYNREKAFREAVSALAPEDRTEENIMQLAAQYGTTQTVMSSLASLTGKREATLARQEAAQAKIDEKKALQLEKQQGANQAALAAIMPVMDSIEKAIPLVGMSTAGVGSLLSYIPGTDAKTLTGYIDTIKANLGFQQLQAMRQASPTGGALGQVAVKELEALQSTIANLDPKQSPDVLRQNLKKVRDHYIKWKETLEKSVSGETTQNAPAKEQWLAAARNAPQNKMYSDAQLSEYYDKTYGGK